MVKGQATQPQKILILAASPVDQAKLRLDVEAREIDESLRRSQHRDQFQLKKLGAVRTDDLRRALLDTKPQIVHFCGHGTGEDGLVFEDELGLTQLVSTEALANLFDLFAGEIECVVLNACYSEVQAKAIVQHVGYVIGMNKAIGDKAAIKFSIGFYDALGGGRSVEDAYKFGRNAIQSEGISEHLTPVLKINTAWKSVLKPLRRPVGIPFQAPPLPTYYVDRPEYSQDLKNRLLTESEDVRTLVVTAIHGLGSVGKSTLATALARDPEVQAHFCDGILWATLGQQPNLLSLLSGWVQELSQLKILVWVKIVKELKIA